MKKRIIALLLITVMILTSFTACGKKSPTSVALKIGNFEVTREELLYYYAYYETIGTLYGSFNYEKLDDFWKAKTEDGVTYREFYYTSAFAELTYMTIMSELAKKEGFTLTDSEIASADKDAEDFYADFTDKEKSKSGITLDGFKIALERQLLVGKYETALQEKMDVNKAAIRLKFKPADYPAKETEYICISLTDSSGKALEGQELEKAYETLNAAAEKFKAGASASDVAKEYEGKANISSGKRYLCKASSFEKEYTEATDILNNGEFSDVIKGDKRAYVAKMVDTDSKEYYEYVVEDAIQKELDKQMSEYYEKIAVSYTRSPKDLIITQEQFGTFVIDPASF